jgi:hypothetical protein
MQIVDTLSRSVDPVTGVLRTERLLTCKQSVPGMLRRWLKSSSVDDSDVAYAYEISELDPVTQQYTARSVNLSFAHLVKVHESLSLQGIGSDGESLPSTFMKQTAEITALGGLSRWCNVIEESMLNRFKSNAQLGRAGFEQALDIVVNEALELGDRALDVVVDGVKELVVDKVAEL